MFIITQLKRSASFFIQFGTCCLVVTVLFFDIHQLNSCRLVWPLSLFCVGCHHPARSSYCQPHRDERFVGFTILLDFVEKFIESSDTCRTPPFWSVRLFRFVINNPTLCVLGMNVRLHFLSFLTSSCRRNVSLLESIKINPTIIVVFE